MKKTLIALAAVAVSSAAFAQVTISGRLDLGHASVKTTSTDGTDTDVSKAQTWAGDQHGRTTSRLTFAGSEDIGNGLKASFNYETRLNPDNTAAPGLDRTRNMFINLTGGFGSVTIGTYLNAFDAIRGTSAATYSAPGGDFLANHVGIAASLFGTEDSIEFGGLTAGANDAAGRAANAVAAARVQSLINNGISGRSTDAIGYNTKIGDFTLGFGVTNTSSSVSANGVTTDEVKGRGYQLAANYAKGPLSVSAATGAAKRSLLINAVTATAFTGAVAAMGESSSKTSDTALAASYDLGVAKVYVQNERTKTTLNQMNGVVLADATYKTNATEVGASFPMGALTPYVTVGSGKITLGDENIKTSAYQVGSTYTLSKRTYAYGALGQMKQKANNDGGTSKTTGYKVGVVHSF